METISHTIKFNLGELECSMNAELYIEDAVSHRFVTFDDLDTITIKEFNIQIDPYKLRDINFDRILETAREVAHDISIHDLKAIYKEQEDAYRYDI